MLKIKDYYYIKTICFIEIFVNVIFYTLIVLLLHSGSVSPYFILYFLLNHMVHSVMFAEKQVDIFRESWL